MGDIPTQLMKASTHPDMKILAICLTTTRVGGWVNCELFDCHNIVPLGLIVGIVITEDSPCRHFNSLFLIRTDGLAVSPIDGFLLVDNGGRNTCGWVGM